MEIKKPEHPPSAAGRVAVNRRMTDGSVIYQKTKRHPVTDASRMEIKKPAAPYSRTGESRTTLGEGALNFRVRNGNGCDNSSMATGKKPKLES